MKRFKPVLIIGLGKYGAEIARTLSAAVQRRNPDLSKVTACVCLDDQGELRDDATAAASQVDSLDPSLRPGVFSENFKVVQARDKRLSDFLADRLLGLRPQQAVLDLQDRGYRIDEGVNVYLVTALSDPVGSAALIPFIGFVQALLVGRLRGMSVQLDLLGFFPDLFDEYKASDLAYARAYTTLAELDLVAERPSLLVAAPRSGIHYAHLFTARNEDGVETGSYQDLSAMVGEVVSLLLEGKVAADASFSMSLLRTLDTKRTRFSSLGLSKLLFPRESVMKALADYSGAAILDTGALFGANSFDRQRVTGDVKDLVIGQKLDRLNDRMRRDPSGKAFWIDFVYTGSTGEQVTVDGFLEDLAEEAREYERTTFNAVNRAVAERRDQLTSETTEALARSNAACMDNPEKGVYYAQATLDVLLNRPSARTHGEDPLEPYSLDVVRREATRFFDKAFGIDRELPARLKRDLDAKKKAREGHAQALGQKQPAVGNEAGAQLEVEALNARIDGLDDEIKDLDRQYGEAAEKVVAFDLKMLDASERRALLASLKAGDEEERQKLETTLREHDAQYRAAVGTLEDLYERRRQVGLRLVFGYPAILLALVVLASYLAARDLDWPTILAGVSEQWRTVAGLFALYAVGAFVHYWVGIRRLLKEGVANVERWKAAKRGALVAVQDFYNRSFARDFDHAVQNGLFTWVSHLERYASDLAERLQGFVLGLEQISAASRLAFDSLSFPNTVLCRNVVTKASVERLIAENARLVVEQARFFTRRPLSAYFNDYRASGSLSSLGHAFADFAEDVFSGVRAKSIEEFMQDEEAAGRVRTGDRLHALVDSSRAFVHLDVERGLDKSENLVYLGVSNADSSPALSFLSQHDKSVIPFATGDDQEIVICKLKVGFPAFHVGLVGYGRRLAQVADAKHQLHAEPNWDPPDLVPSLYTLGDKDDEARCQLCLGLALGLVVKRRERFEFGSDPLGGSMEEAIELLRSFGGRNLRAALGERIKTATALPGALEHLTRYRESLSDPIDLAILDRAIGELDALV